MNKWLSLMIVFSAICLPAMGQDSDASSEQQRFEAEKRSRTQHALYSYLIRAKMTIQGSWHPEGLSSFKIAKIKATLDSSGNVTSSKILVPSKSPSYDKSITDFLTTCNLQPLPYETKSLDLYLTFMADSSMSMIEYAQTPEADNYYKDMVGGRVLPTGMVTRDRQTPTRFPFDRATVPTSAPQVSANAPTTKSNQPLEPLKDGTSDPYLRDLERRIKRAWFPPKGTESKRVVVQFKVHRGGELSNLRIDHSSGLAIADRAALKAVENAAPFRPLPANATDELDIQFTFDYNLFGGGGHAACRVF